MLVNLFEVRETKNKGKGLFAIRNIPAGTIVGFICENCKKLFTKEEFECKSEEEKYEILAHTFIDEEGSVIEDCDNARYMNHSCNANILDSGLGFDICVREIKKGEEGTYDYRQFNDGAIKVFKCECGESNCCKQVVCRRPIPKDLLEYWNKKVRTAIELINNTQQPLKDELIKHDSKYENLFKS